MSTDISIITDDSEIMLPTFRKWKGATRGKSVKIIKDELEEVLSLSDRIAVIYEGEIMGIVTPDIEIHKLGLMMAGTHFEDLDKVIEQSQHTK
jgi:ABC-type multidrug transport system ATPase subunit